MIGFNGVIWEKTSYRLNGIKPAPLAPANTTANETGTAGAGEYTGKYTGTAGASMINRHRWRRRIQRRIKPAPLAPVYQKSSFSDL
jgi:hypothetical protein